MSQLRIEADDMLYLTRHMAAVMAEALRSTRAI